MVRTGERVNVQAALDYLREAGGLVFGLPQIRYVVGPDGPEGDTSNSVSAAVAGNPEPVPIIWDRLPRAHEQTLDCARNALYLLRWQGHPFCALVQGVNVSFRTH